MQLRSTAGFTLIEVTLVIVLILTLSLYLISDFTNQDDSIRWEQSRTKLQTIRSAILGDDATNSEGQRTHFGYIGDMGKIPGALTDLTTRGSQPAWAYDATTGFGYGWRGPYIAEAITGGKAIDKDEWGFSFTYNTSEPTPSLRSNGSDNASGGSVFAKDIIVELPQTLRQATVRGVLQDRDSKLSGKTVQIDFSSNGALASSSTTTSADGSFSISGIPFGMRSIRVTSTPPLAPRPILVDRSEVPVSSSTLNYAGSSEALTYVASSASLWGSSTLGFSNQLVSLTLKSTYREDRRVAAITGNWTTASQLIAITVNGIRQVLSASSASGTRTAITGNMIVPGLTDVNSVLLEFDTNMRSEPIGLTFEWSGTSQRDAVTFTPSGVWGLAGTVDTSFGTAGSILVSHGGASDSGRAIAFQTDTKVMGAGWDGSDCFLWRMNYDGTLDTSFNTVGRALLHVSGTDQCYQVYIQTDGKVVASGKTATDALIVRYTTNGRLDTTFSTIGYATRNLSGTDWATGGAMGTDGKITLSSFSDSGGFDFWLVRFSSNGTVDTTFSTDGIAMVPSAAGGTASARNSTMDTTGRFLLTAMDAAAADWDFAVWRITTNGVLDTTFNTTGKAFYSFTNSTDLPFGIRTQTDGKIVTAGQSGGADVAVMRLNTNGTLDTSFRTTGKSITNISGTDAAWGGVYVQANSRLVIGSHYSNLNGFSLMRLTTNGSLDTSFRTNGNWMFTISGTEYPTQLNADTGGKILMVGGSKGSSDVVVMRFWP